MIEFKTLEEYPGYRFGSNGTVWSQWSNSGKLREWWKRIYGCNDTYGYLQVDIKNKEGKFIKICIHTLILLAFKGSKPYPWYECRHIDGCKSNNDIINICWGTHAKNMKDREKLGENNPLKGSKHPNSLVIEEQVIEVKKMLRIGTPVWLIVEKLKISRQIITHIKFNRAWTHITVPND